MTAQEFYEKNKGKRAYCGHALHARARTVMGWRDALVLLSNDGADEFNADERRAFHAEVGARYGCLSYPYKIVNAAAVAESTMTADVTIVAEKQVTANDCRQAAERALAFLGSLDLAKHSLFEQRERREVMHLLMKALSPTKALK